MIPSQTLEEFEPFAESGDKVAPVPAKYAQGYLPGEVFPAQHENFLMGKASRCSTQHRAGLRSIEAELNNVVDAGGAEPDDTDDTQVLDAINYLIAQAIAAEREKDMPKGFLWWTSTPPTSPGGDPNTLFPGTTWVRLKDAFIWAAGDSDTVTPAIAGSAKTADGGSSTVTVQADNLPQHTHALGGNTGLMSADTTNGGSTNYTGSGGQFKCNNISDVDNGCLKITQVNSGSYGGTSTNYKTMKVTINVNHSHSLPANTRNNSTQHNALNIKNPYINRYCWERVS